MTKAVIKTMTHLEYFDLGYQTVPHNGRDYHIMIPTHATIDVEEIIKYEGKYWGLRGNLAFPVCKPIKFDEVRVGGMCNTLNAYQSDANHRYSKTGDKREDNLSWALRKAQELIWEMYDELKEKGERE